MKSFCMFREKIDSPIFKSSYDFSTGLIKNVPKSKFELHLPRLYYDFYDVPYDFGIVANECYYYAALNVTGGLFVTNCYNDGFTVVTPDTIYVYVKDTWYLMNDGEAVPDNSNIFKYNKNCLGLYKTVVTQFDLAQSFVRLYVDDKGNFLTGNGDCFIGYTHNISEPDKIKNVVKAWRNGFDGILLDKVGNQVTYKITSENEYVEGGV